MFKTWFQKMLKHTQTIRRQWTAISFGNFKHFARSSIKRLKIQFNISYLTSPDFISIPANIYLFKPNHKKLEKGVKYVHS